MVSSCEWLRSEAIAGLVFVQIETKTQASSLGNWQKVSMSLFGMEKELNKTIECQKILSVFIQ